MEIEPRDLVQLKLGGPSMTVEQIGKASMRAEDEDAVVVLLTRPDLDLPAATVPLSDNGFPLTGDEILALFRAGHVNREAIAVLAAEGVIAIIGRRGSELHRAMQPAMLGTA